MPSSFRDPKTLPEWIELDYYRRRRRLPRIRSIVIWLTLFVCAAAIGVITILPKGRLIYESRPVSSAHKMFNERCESCHQDWFRPAARFLSGKHELRSVDDWTCAACHAGPPHHMDKVVDPGCVDCHTEHKGETVLAKVPDSHCTAACHADLSRYQSKYHATIGAFSMDDHPSFGTWRGKELDDPGTIRFNHAVHMNLKKDGTRGIDEQLVKLEAKSCGYCHDPDTAGRYMKPLNYERHCGDCHPLSIRVGGNGEHKELAKAIADFCKEPAPHREASTVRAALQDRYRGFLANHRSVLKAAKGEALLRPLPGADPHPKPVQSDEVWLADQVRQGEHVLFDGAGGCRYCHAVARERKNQELPKYKLTLIRSALTPRDRWFEHSYFSHDRHRMLECTECHHQARTSHQTADVLMPTISDCVQCHNAKVGARTDCIECHRYHNQTDAPFVGKLKIHEAAVGQVSNLP